MNSAEPGRRSKASSADTYDLFDHTHRFSIWAAARAAGRGFGVSSARMIRALPGKLVKLLRDGHSTWPKSKLEFDRLHRKCCKHICRIWGRGSYGRAAKFLNVYLKCMLVLTKHHQSDFAQLAHPPIDRYLLQELARKVEGVDRETKALWKNAKWTKLSRDQYFDVVNSLREAGLTEDGFWRIEEYWDPYKDQSV